MTTDQAAQSPRRWLDFPRPNDSAYYEERFPFLSQGDILADAPLLAVPPELLIDETDGGQVIAAIPLLRTSAMIITPTCDFRRPGADYLAEHAEEDPYQLRRQLVVARILPFDQWERSQAPKGRTDRTAQVRSFDNVRQYMYLPPIGDEMRESMVDLGTTWTLPLEIVLRLDRLTQLAEQAAAQLQYKVIMYAAALVIDRDALRPPMD